MTATFFSGMRASRLTGALLSMALFAGCASMPRPVPPGNQPVATAQAAGVVVSVPRLDTGDYPGDMLDISAAVLVMIENRGQTEVLINPEGFLLGAAGGQGYSPIPPQQLAFKVVPADPAGAPANLAEGADRLAWRGGGGVHVGGGGMSVRSAPSYSGFRGGSVGVRPAPSYGGGYGGRSGWVSSPRSSWGGRPAYGGYGYGGYRSYSRPGFYYGRPWWWWNGPAYWGSTWGMSWYANPSYWDGPRAYAWSRGDALRLSLPAGRLPPGGKTGGFLYFPKVEHPEGTPLYLTWQVRDAASQQVIGEVQLPLEHGGE